LGSKKRPPSSARGRKGPADKPCVLVVEDDAAFAGLLTAVLEGEGYGVATAESTLGAAGLVETVRPAVILLDVGLPYRSGASFLKTLKAAPATATIPVVVITAMPEVLTDDRREMAAAVLEKPIDVRILAELVRDLCVEPGSGRTRSRRQDRRVTRAFEADDGYDL
jgi:CheY-like chemotaxis protein